MRFERSMYPRFLVSSTYLIRDVMNAGKSRITSPSCRLPLVGFRLPITVWENPVLIPTVFQDKFNMIFSHCQVWWFLVSALCISVRMTLILCSRGWWDWKSKNWSVCSFGVNRDFDEALGFLSDQGIQKLELAVLFLVTGICINTTSGRKWRHHQPTVSWGQPLHL